MIQEHPILTLVSRNNCYMLDRSMPPTQVQRLVATGCMAYLAYVLDVSGETPFVGSILVVCEFFFYIYTANLHGLSLERDINFAIDLEQGAKSISMPPYRIAFAKLKELHVQL